MLSLPVLLVSSVVCSAGAPDLDNAVLDFTATWCGPCQQMGPTVARLEREGLPLHRVDVDKNRDLANRFKISSIPAFVVVVNGKEVERITGKVSEAKLREMCRRIPAPDSADSSPAAGRKEHPETPQDPAAARRSEAVTGEGFSPSEKGRKNPPAGPRGQSPAAPGQRRVPPVNEPFPATVRIRLKDPSGDDVGTGTIIDSRPEQSLILTCGHIFRHWSEKGSKILVDIFERGKERTVVGRKVAFDLDSDVALIAISTDELLPSCQLVSRRFALTKGTPVVSVGCNGGEPPTVEKHQVVALNRYRGPDNVECTGVPVPGRSGGGLFTQSGQVVGVCRAEDPHYKDGMYAAIEPVYQLLVKSGLSGLIGDEPPVELATTKDDSKRRRAELSDDDTAEEAAAQPDSGDGLGEAEDELSEQEDEVAAADLPADEPPEPPVRRLAGGTASEDQTARLVRKAMRHAAKGDLIFLMPGNAKAGQEPQVLVVHDPSDSVLQKLKAGPDLGPPREVAFRGKPADTVRESTTGRRRSSAPAAVERDRGSRSRDAIPRDFPFEGESHEKVAVLEEEDDLPLPAVRSLRSKARESRDAGGDGGYRRGKRMPLRGTTASLDDEAGDE